MKKRVQRTISIAMPGVHVCLCLATVAGLFGSEGSWKWFPMFIVDLPFSLLLFPALRIADPFLVFVVAGTAWWWALSRLALYCARRLFK